MQYSKEIQSNMQNNCNSKVQKCTRDLRKNVDGALIEGLLLGSQSDRLSGNSNRYTPHYRPSSLCIGLACQYRSEPIVQDDLHGVHSAGSNLQSLDHRQSVLPKDYTNRPKTEL